MRPNVSGVKKNQATKDDRIMAKKTTTTATKKKTSRKTSTDTALRSMIGKPICLFCANYIYNGVLVSVSDSDVTLTNAHIVYETGPLTNPTYKDAQALYGTSWNVSRGAIESFGPGK
jgi:hypothetical protein